ncbi:MAG: hypothetical protein AB1746_05375 [Candidatus Zixiibacteriota bacterium]
MKKVLVFAAAALIILAAFAVADPGHRGFDRDRRGCSMDGRGMGHFGDQFFGPGMLMRVADEIGLDDAQKTKIASMSEQFGLERIDKEAALDKAELELKHMRMNGASDSEILAQMDKVGKLGTEMQKMAFTHHQAMKGVLTADQVTKLKELRQERREDRGPRSGCGFGQGQGMGNNPDVPGQGAGPGPGPNNPDCWRR